MEGLEIIVELAETLPGFRTGHAYPVYGRYADRMLLVNDAGRFCWLEADKLAPVSIVQGDKKLFDRDEFDLKRRYERYIGQLVLVTTWEDLGLPLDHTNDEGMMVYRVIADNFDGQLLMLRGGEGLSERSGVLVSQIYSIESVDGAGGASRPSEP